jgi:hypothetical protein
LSIEKRSRTQSWPGPPGDVATRTRIGVLDPWRRRQTWNSLRYSSWLNSVRSSQPTKWYSPAKYMKRSWPKSKLAPDGKRQTRALLSQAASVPSSHSRARSASVTGPASVRCTSSAR